MDSCFDSSAKNERVKYHFPGILLHPRFGSAKIYSVNGFSKPPSVIVRQTWAGHTDLSGNVLSHAQYIEFLGRLADQAEKSGDRTQANTINVSRQVAISQAGNPSVDCPTCRAARIGQMQERFRTL